MRWALRFEEEMVRTSLASVMSATDKAWASRLLCLMAEIIVQPHKDSVRFLRDLGHPPLAFCDNKTKLCPR